MNEVICQKACVWGAEMNGVDDVLVKPICWLTADWLNSDSLLSGHWVLCGVICHGNTVSQTIVCKAGEGQSNFLRMKKISDFIPDLVVKVSN